MTQELPPLPKGAVAVAPPLPIGAVVIDVKPSFERMKLFDMQDIEGEPLKREIIKGKMTGGRDPMPADMPENITPYKERAVKHFGMVIPEDDRYKQVAYWLSTTPGRDIDKANAVRKVYGGEAELKFHKGYDDYVIEFKDGRVAPFNAPGVDMQSVAGSMEGALAIGIEIAGGIGGLGGGPAGIALGTSLGAAHGERERLKRGQNISGLTDAEVNAKAAMVGAMTLGGDLVLGGAGIAIRRYMGNPLAKKLFGSMSKPEIDAMVAAADKFGDNLTSSQALAQAAREAAQRGDNKLATQLRRRATNLAGGEEALLRRGEADELSKSIDTQNAELMGLEQTVTKGAADTTESRHAVGQDVVRNAQREVSESENNIVMQIQREVDDVVAAEMDRFKSRDLNVVGSSLREELKVAEKNIMGKDGVMDKAYGEIWKQIPDDVGVDLSVVRKVGSKWRERIKGDAFPSLTEESRSIINDALRLGIKGGEVKTTPSRLPPIKVGRETMARPPKVEVTPVMDDPKSVATISRAISQLKQEVRMIDSGAVSAKPRQKALLIDLQNELTRARDAAIKNIDPNLQTALRAQDGVYHSAIERIKGSMLGRIVSKKRGGGWKVSSEKVMGKILKDPDELRTLYSLADDYPEYDLKNTLREGVYAAYQKDVLDGKGAHNTFMRSHGEAIDTLFTPAERRRFADSEDAQRFIKGQERREKLALNGLKKELGYKFAEYDPYEVYKLATKNPGYAKKAMSLMSEARQKDFKALYMRDVLEAAQTQSDFGDRVMDLQKLRSFRSENANMIKTVLGDKYYSDLGIVEKVLRLERIPKHLHGELANLMKEEGPAGAGMLFWRALYARPLSRLGVATTGALKLTRSASRKAVDKLLADPKLLAMSVSMYNNKLDKPLHLLKSVGLAELAKQIEDMRDDSK